MHLRPMADQTPKQSRRDDRTTKAYGVVLQTYRKQASITQEELAARCDMDRAYISEIERGLKEPCLSTLLKLGRVLQVSAGDMLKDVEKQLAD